MPLSSAPRCSYAQTPFPKVVQEHPEYWHRLDIIANQAEAEMGDILLDTLDAASHELRAFIIEKFKFEDVI
jgi:hypothetical protein